MVFCCCCWTSSLIFSLRVFRMNSFFGPLLDLLCVLLLLLESSHRLSIAIYRTENYSYCTHSYIKTPARFHCSSSIASPFIPSMNMCECGLLHLHNVRVRLSTEVKLLLLLQFRAYHNYMRAFFVVAINIIILVAVELASFI